MRYEEFRDAFRRSLRDSRMPETALAEEAMDLERLCRTYKAYVEPIGRQKTEPFHATASLSWRWSALDTYRGIYREEDLLTEVLGRDEYETNTEPRRLRVDIRLVATTPHGKPLPLPSPKTWAAWARETIGRLEKVEPIVPDEHVEEMEDGGLAILAWQGNPTVELECTASGELRLQRLEVEAFQFISVPRRWDNPDREPEDRPEGELDAMFARVKASLFAWMETLDHLTPR